MTDAAQDPADVILAALAQLRGRRGPRPPWQNGPPAPGPEYGGWPRGGPHHHHRPGAGPWGAGPQGRFGGPARLRVLEALVAASRPLTVSEVADAVGVDQPRASRLVQQGVELGLVRREADPDDARRTLIVLTDEGRALVRSLRGERRELIDAALAEFTETEREQLARLLAKLAAAWPRG